MVLISCDQIFFPAIISFCVFAPPINSELRWICEFIEKTCKNTSKTNHNVQIINKAVLLSTYFLSHTSQNKIKVQEIFFWNRSKKFSNWGWLTYIRPNRECKVCLSWIVLPKNIQFQDCKTTFKQNVTCIFLSVRVNLENPLYHDGSCTCRTKR